jgi:large repetitive protein
LKIRAAACLLILVFSQVLPVQASQDSPENWTNVGPGVDYRLYVVGTQQYPNRVHVARMERSNPAVTIESAIAGGRLARMTETTSAMGRRYDGAINFWGNRWGQTNRVIVAVNGFYVENYNWPFPQSGQIHSGWYSKRFVNLNGNVVSGSGFAWKLDRTPFIGVGDCVTHPPHKQIVTFPERNREILFHGINTARPANSLIIYTPQYDSRTPTQDIEVEVLVELSRPLLIIPSGSAAVLGRVMEVRQSKVPLFIPFDHIVLSGRGSAASLLLEAARVGEEVRINQEITNVIEDKCTIKPPVEWDKTYASIGGQYNFLINGVVYNTDEKNAVHPRTAVAYDSNYIYFIVVDGRAPGFSVGMTITQLGNFARDYLGATWGIALDGGGSSTMVINDVVVNRPSDPCYFLFLPLAGRDEGGAPLPQIFDPELGFQRINGSCERPTGNGLMMVAVEPENFSNTFVPAADRVETRGHTNVRLGPGSNYPVFASVPGGARGSIVEHAANLNGVYAKNQYWWKVDFGGGTIGWVIEDALQSSTSTVSLWRHFR